MTDATPRDQEPAAVVTSLVGGSLAHVRAGSNHRIATFQARLERPRPRGAGATDAFQTTFGTIEEDAWRRDLTVNALY
jgi:tRNA nucleotidyltransferase/poly(A) polymerase